MGWLYRPHVVWTFRAERRLEQALVRGHVTGGAAIATEERMSQLNHILAAVFPAARNVLVLDQFLGFRYRPEEHILLVEVRDSKRPGNYVVKVKPPDDLGAELRAWESCWPAGLRHDLVFMTLEPCYRRCRLAALVYEDAQQFIGVDRTNTLEEAFLGAVQHGSPTPDSVANVLTELFARAGHLLYRAAAPVAPAAADVRLNGDHHIGERLGLWDTKPSAVVARQIGNAVVPIGQEGFVDPVDFLRFICDELKAGRPAANLVPSMLRGKAHGDLHGRNVLVGVVRDRAHWPALFDYEHMQKDNLVGWDFAKLETELKIRAYPLVYADLKPLDFAQCVLHVETTLGRQTEQYRRAGGWPAPGGGTPEERLLTVLLTLRRLAGMYLGEEHGRADQSLEELYFLLGCYGVNTGKYDNQKPLERLGAFLSAGVALARFEYLRRPRMM